MDEWGWCKPNVFGIELLVRSKSVVFGFVFPRVVFCFREEAFGNRDLSRGSERSVRSHEANLAGSLFSRSRQLVDRGAIQLDDSRRLGRGKRSSGSRGSVGYLGCNPA